MHILEFNLKKRISLLMYLNIEINVINVDYFKHLLKDDEIEKYFSTRFYKRETKVKIILLFTLKMKYT